MKVIIDQIEHEVDGKPTILEVASKVGVEIPHFCYHPGLSISGNCRMCLVEAGTPKMGPNGVELDADGKPVILWMPKPTTACSTQMSEGMQVKTHKTSKVVEEAQKGVLEFILINHPLDCPICDQAGECPLQENTFQYGPEGSRFEFEKNSKPKRVELGPNVMFDAERCINCTRCVRFSEEVAKAPQLTVINRGDRNYIATFPGMELDNPYSMNVIDICPVGALTSKHFRFKARVWEMSETDSICTGCSAGCNVKVWVKNNEVLRVTPRENPTVNQWWMCDQGRLGFTELNENRVSGPSFKGQAITWEEAAAKLSDLTGSVPAEEIAVIVSPFATLEDNFAVISHFKAAGVTSFVRFDHTAGSDDHLLIKADKSPNQAALTLLEKKAGGFLTGKALASAITSGKLRVLVSVQENPFGGELTSDHRSALKAVISFSTNLNETTSSADLVLPAATHAETLGTFINAKGILQKVRPAKILKHQNRSLMRETGLSRWDKHAWKYDKWAQPTHVTDAKPVWEILSGEEYKSAEQVFSRLAKELPALNSVSWSEIGTGGIQLEPASKPETVKP
ncbi:MAG: 2Fe-2S iron-sulfur cluster-binding protein [Bacteroidetes bacterium]|nr:2Fe-2S iron-sulfur cluster-binding protein [Bacteroidota bacterium]